ncbi:MAG TPA: glycoside hydrolase family 2, partial [Clostridia bacterium]
YKGTSKRLFSGKLLAIVASTYEPGDMEITVSSSGMETQSLKISSIPCSYPEGLSNTLFENKSSDPKKEIPVRKIELVSLDGNRLDQNKRSVTVKAILHPENTSYQDVEWRVTDDSGYDSIIADVEANGKTAVLTAKTDGKVRLRCAARNGRNYISMYSQLEFEISGFGEANLDPYSFISGSQYNYCSRELGIGIERGVTTPIDGAETVIGFKNINFGDFGSDEITIPIFSPDQEVFPIEIWEGIPGEPGSELLDTVIYTKGSIWNTYQEQAYKLRKRISGIKTISFALRKRINIKGFSFKKIDKAYEKICVKDCSRIYGDTYRITEDAVEDIGNNVSIEFDDMDFTDTGTDRLLICASSNNANNTIHIRFSDGLNTVGHIAEFPCSPEYTVREFSIEPVTGKQKLTFIFLPGSRINFKWFKFLRS